MSTDLANARHLQPCRSRLACRSRDPHAGYVYVTDAAVAKDKVTMIPIPDIYNVIAQYPIAVTKGSTHASDAQAFMQYILSKDGQDVLQQYGFIAINP